MGLFAFGVLFLVVLGWCSSSIVASSNEVENAGLIFDVTTFGAKGDGVTDDSQAFLNAWNAACKSTDPFPTVNVPPEKVFLVNTVAFNGPCTAPTVNFKVSGTIKAPVWAPSPSVSQSTMQWLGFLNVKGLHIDGPGLIDGQGMPWWKQSCKTQPKLPSCTTAAPTACRFAGCDESSIKNVNIKNSPQVHMRLEDCNGFTIENITIDTPGDTPNTDGIQVSSSQRVTIDHSNIGCGDDCIAINNGTSGMQIDNIHCGPGHGISIGSLGRDGSFAQVQDINVTNAFFDGTKNGARIKTWEGGKGFIRNIRYENLTFTNTENPICITQHYCEKGCNQDVSGELQISNVVYRGAVGTSASDIAIRLNCTQSTPCVGITMESINITAVAAGKEVVANCINAFGQQTNVVPANPCLQKSAFIVDI